MLGLAMEIGTSLEDKASKCKNKVIRPLDFNLTVPSHFQPTPTTPSSSAVLAETIHNNLKILAQHALHNPFSLQIVEEKIQLSRAAYPGAFFPHFSSKFDTLIPHPLEGVYKVRVRRVFGLFWPLFDSFYGGSVRKHNLSHSTENVISPMIGQLSLI